MAALLLPLSLVVILHGLHVALANEDADAYSTFPRLKVEPELKGGVKILKPGEQISFTCTFLANEGDHHTKAEKLYWRNSYGTEIDNDIKKKVHTKTPSGRLRRVLILVIKDADETIAGTSYTCGADFAAQALTTKEVSVVVSNPPTWVDNRREITGRINDKLEINCEAKSKHMGQHVDVDIRFQNNSQFPADRYVIPKPQGMQLVIFPLTMAERNVGILCLAFETDKEEVLENSKVVNINVLFPPIFESEHVTRYGIVGRSVILPCRVVDSNPPVANFYFYAGEKDLHHGEKYKIAIDREHNMANLTILDLTDEDFDTQGYSCHAQTEDNVFRHEMTFTLQKAFPPEVPQVTFKAAGRGRIVFDIHEVKSPYSNNPPVTHFEIRHVSFSEIKDLDEAERKRLLAESQARLMNKTDSNNYIVDHLHWNTLYVFEIRAVNEAGHSDPFVYNATTLDHDQPEAMSSMASTVSLPHWSVVVLLVQLIITSIGQIRRSVK